MGIHDRKQRTVVNPTDPLGEQDIQGPSGQHSNTPFRRNRSANVVETMKSVSAQSSPSSSYLRKTLSPKGQSAQSAPSAGSTGFAKYLDSTKEFDIHEGEVDYATAIGAALGAMPTAPGLMNRRSLPIGRSISKKEGQVQSDDEFDKEVKRDVRARSLSSTETAHQGGDAADGIQLTSVSHLPPLTSSPARKRSPKRRSRDEKDMAEGDLTVVEATGSPSGGEDEEDDDYDYSVDEDDIDVDVDLAALGIKDELEVETEDEDHFDDGDSDVDTSAAPSEAAAPQIDNVSSDEGNTPHTRRECEDEGEGLKGIEGSQLAPMLRVTAGGLVGLASSLPKRAKSIVANSAHSVTTNSPGKPMGRSASGRNSCASVLEGGVSGRDSVVTFGPGASQNHPWTLRKDTGINSRRQDGSRGDEIYYIGVIDILQQYNMRKRAETFIKV